MRSLFPISNDIAASPRPFPPFPLRERGRGGRFARCVCTTVTIILAVVLLPMTAVCAEGKPEILTEVDPKDIFLGETATFLVQIKNLKKPVAPDMSAFETDFTVRSQGDRTQDQSMINIVNGQMYQETVYSHIYQYQLIPKRAGTLTAPAPFVMVDGNKILGTATQLLVRAQENQDLAIAEIAPSKTRVYPTQPFDVTLCILLKPMAADDSRDPLSMVQPAELTVDWLNVPEGLTAPDLQQWLSAYLVQTGHGFSINNLTVRDNDPMNFFDSQRHAILGLYTRREKRKCLDGTEINYYVYELKRTFTPQKTGAFTFGPATVKGTFVDGLTGRKYTARRLVLIAPAASVEVRDVPAPAPPTFCGGLGAFDVTAAASPTTLRVGDPLTLKLAFTRQKGSGGLDLISAPDIAANPQLAADFEIMDKAPTGQSAGEIKTFAYGLRPKRAGVTIPALSVSLFNADTEKFNEHATEPIALTVTQSSQVGAGDLVAAPLSPHSTLLRNQQGGVFQNFQEMGALQDQRTDPIAYAIAALALWGACALGSLLVLRGRRRANDAVWQRRQRARPEAERRLNDARSAQQNGNALAAAQSARAAVTGLIGDMLGLPAAGMTAHEANTALTKAAVSDPLRKRASELLESIEALEYASSGNQNIAASIAAAAALLPDLQRELNK